MSFREKSAWITFILLLLVFGFYFVSFGAVLFAGVRGTAELVVFHIGFFLLFGLLVAAIIVAEIVLHIIIAARSPADAKSPQDERERLIELKAKRPAYFVLVTAAFLSIGLLHVRGGAWALANGILCAIWLGELTNYGAQIYFYRRGA